MPWAQQQMLEVSNISQAGGANYVVPADRPDTGVRYGLVRNFEQVPRRNDSSMTWNSVDRSTNSLSRRAMMSSAHLPACNEPIDLVGEGCRV